MSYILDALKRADAKRTSELLPSGNATATRVVFADTQPYRSNLPWPWIATCFALLLAGFVAWHFWPQAAAPLATPPAAPQVAALPSPAPLTALHPNQTPAIADRAPAPPVAVPSALAASAPSAAATTPDKTGAAPAAAAAAGAGTTAQRPSAMPATAAENRVYAQEELPVDVRAELPKLSITGSAYSDNAAHRMLIINGQVLREKDEVASGVVLEQIQPKFAVLRFKGLRYRLPY